MEKPPFSVYPLKGPFVDKKANNSMENFLEEKLIRARTKILDIKIFQSIEVSDRFPGVLKLSYKALLISYILEI